MRKCRITSTAIRYPLIIGATSTIRDTEIEISTGSIVKQTIDIITTTNTTDGMVGASETADRKSHQLLILIHILRVLIMIIIQIDGDTANTGTK